MPRKSRALLLIVTVALLAAAFSATARAAFEPVLEFGPFGPDAGELQGPGDVLVAEDGTIYVSDFTNRRIDVFSSTGGFLRAFGKGVNLETGAGVNPDVCTTASGCGASAATHEAGALNSPEAIGISGDRIYIANIAQNRIDVVKLNGEFLFAFGRKVNAEAGAANPDICTAKSDCVTALPSGAAGAMDEPQGLGIGAGGDVYVADRKNNRIDVFSAAGTFKFAFGGQVNILNATAVCTAESGCKKGTEGAAGGEMNSPRDVKAASSRQLVVSDRANRRIDVYSASGVFEYAFARGVNPDGVSGVCTIACQKGEEGGAAGTILPGSIEVDAVGHVYIAESTTNRVSVFSLAGQFEKAFGEGVLDGAEAFQVCLLGANCQAGTRGTIKGAIPRTLGVAFDPTCAIYATENAGEFARVERFADPAAAPAPCPVVTFPPSEPEGPPTKEPPPSNRFSFGGLKLNRGAGVATLVVRVPGPGSLSLAGKGIRKAQRAVAAAGAVRLPIRLVGSAKRKLSATGKATVRATVTFTPTGGKAGVQSKVLTLRKKPSR
jgi:DNA-binding beta-propeller fold protein YncE